MRNSLWTVIESKDNYTLYETQAKYYIMIDPMGKTTYLHNDKAKAVSWWNNFWKLVEA